MVVTGFVISGVSEMDLGVVAFARLDPAETGSGRLVVEVLSAWGRPVECFADLPAALWASNDRREALAVLLATGWEAGVLLGGLAAMWLAVRAVVSLLAAAIRAMAGAAGVRRGRLAAVLAPDFMTFLPFALATASTAVVRRRVRDGCPSPDAVAACGRCGWRAFA